MAASRGLSESNDLLSGLKTQIPQGFRYPMISKTPYMRRKTVKLRPTATNTFSTDGNKEMIFDLPQNPNQILDFRRSGLFVTVSISNTDGAATYTRLPYGAWNVMGRGIFRGSGEYERIEHMGLYLSQLWERNSEVDVGNTAGQALYGTVDAATRSTYGTQDVKYCLPIPLGLLRAGAFPTQSDIMEEKLQIVIYLEDIDRYIETDGAAGQRTVTLKDVFIYYDRIQCDSTFISFLRSNIVRHGLHFGCRTVKHYLQTYSAQTEDLRINHRTSSVDGIVAYPRISAETNDPLINDKSINWPKDSLLNYQYEVGSEHYPPEPVLVNDLNAVEGYVQSMMLSGRQVVSGIWNDAPLLSGTAYNSNRFHCSIDWDIAPGEAYANSMSTEDNGNILLKLNASAPPASDRQMEFWVHFFQVLSLQPSKLFRVIA